MSGLQEKFKLDKIYDEKYSDIFFVHEKIVRLTGHQREHLKDIPTTRRIIQLVSQRSRMLKYVKKNNNEHYTTLMKMLLNKKV
jgi:ribosomal protein S15